MTMPSAIEGQRTGKHIKQTYLHYHPQKIALVLHPPCLMCSDVVSQPQKEKTYSIESGSSCCLSTIFWTSTGPKCLVGKTLKETINIDLAWCPSRRGVT